MQVHSQAKPSIGAGFGLIIYMRVISLLLLFSHWPTIHISLMGKLRLIESLSAKEWVLLNMKKQGLVMNTFISGSRPRFQMCVDFQIKASVVEQGLQLKHLL